MFCKEVTLLGGEKIELKIDMDKESGRDNALKRAYQMAFSVNDVIKMLAKEDVNWISVEKELNSLIAFYRVVKHEAREQNKGIDISNY